MKVTLMPNGEYILQKEKTKCGGSPFIFLPKANHGNGSTLTYVKIDGYISIPPELFGKRIMFKIIKVDE
jgi:hypothetical protein